MKATKIYLMALVFFPVALALDSAAAKGNCSRKVVTAVLQERLGEDQRPLASDISDEVRRCKVMELASVTDNRCASVVALASLFAEGIEDPLQSDINERVNECKGARDSRKAVGADNRCSAEVARAALIGEGVENPTQPQVTDRVRSCKADEHYRKKIREAESSLEKLDAEKSRQARVKALVDTIDTLSKLKQAWLTVPYRDTGPLVPRGN